MSDPRPVRRAHRILMWVMAACTAGALLGGGVHAQGDDDDTDAALTIPKQPDHPDPTEVYVELFVIDIPDIDERAKTVTIDAELYADWYDPRLASAPCESFEDYDLVEGNAARELLGTTIWWPNFKIEEAAGPRQTTGLSIGIDCEGYVWYTERLLVTVAQEQFDFNEFPFDDQELVVTVSPYAQANDRVTFASFEPIAEDDRQGGDLPDDAFTWETDEWEIDDEGFVAPEIYNDGWATAVFSAELTRNATFYAVNIILPLVLIVAVSWAVFWMHPDRMTLSDRLSVSITALLTVVAFDFLTNGDLPRLSYSTRLDNLYIVSYLAVALTVVESVVVEIQSNRRSAPVEGLEGPGDRPPPALDRWSRIVFPIVYLASVAFAMYGPLTS